MVRTEEIQGIILWLVPPAAAIFASVRAFMDGLPWHLILFYGSGVFAFFAASIYFFSEKHRKSTVRGRITLTGSKLRQVYKQNDIEGVLISLSFTIQSHADREIYFKIKRLDVVLDGKTTQEKIISPQTFVMQAQSTSNIRAAAVPGIQIKELLSGKLDMEILYGPSEKTLPFIWEYRGSLELIMHEQEEGRGTSHCSCADEFSEHRLI